MKTLVPIIAATSLLASSAVFAQDAQPANPASPSTAPAERIETPSADTPTLSPETSTDKMAPATEATSPVIEDNTASLTLTDEQAENWIGRSVYSNDNENLGEVAAFKRSPTGEVEELHADIGGFLGLGETRVRVMPDQMKFDGDKIVLNVNGEEADDLPKVEAD